MAFDSRLAGRALSAYNLVIFLGVFVIQWGFGLLVDGLQGLFMHPSPVLKTLRNTGLSAINQSAGLKQWIIDRALSPL